MKRYQTPSFITRTVYNSKIKEMVSTSVPTPSQATETKGKYYRFRTQAEFIATFGANWTNRVQVGWGPAMNEFFGTVFLSVDIPSGKKYTTYRDYTISEEMLVPCDAEYMKEHEAFFAMREKVNSCLTIMPSDNCGYRKFKLLFRGYTVSFVIYSGPTGNCQMASISCFDNILSFYNDVPFIKDILIVAMEKTGFGKKLLFYDVHRKYLEQIKALSYGEPTHYVSTNGSNMIYGLIKLM